MFHLFLYFENLFMTRRDNKLISIYSKFFFFIEIILAYCFFNVFYLRDTNEGENIIDP